MAGTAQPGDAELFRGQMLVEMAAMSLDDGLVLQIHAGSWRDHNPTVAARFGPDKGADIPRAVDYVGGLKPLLDRFGNEPGLTVVVYTLDETTYSRELAPLAGHYPALRLGPPWWFYDSPEGIRRFYQSVVETAGFANTVGFNDDARSLLTIPARHDVARRLNAGYLAGLVAEHRMEEEDAAEIAEDLALQPGPPGLPGRPMKQVVLVGLMGSGKSTVGALVARAHGTGLRRRRRRHRGGRRARPSGSSGRRAARPPTGTSSRRRCCGCCAAPRRPCWPRPGGVVLDPGRARRARRPLRRLAAGRARRRWPGRVRPGDHRPLLGDRPAETLAAMAEERADLYRQVATATIDTDGLTPEAIADVVVGLLADCPADA